jgi:serine O-acetyltransferase
MQVSGLIETVRADLKANVPDARGLYGLVWSTLFADGFQAVMLWRAARFMFGKRWLKPLGRVVIYANARAFNVYISPEASIGSAFALPHPVGVVVGEGAVLGRNVTIYQNVTIGQAGKGDNVYPRIGDRVTIFAGAVVVGDIRLEDDVVVGANAVVLRSVAEGLRVVGSPARPTRTDDLHTHGQREG